MLFFFGFLFLQLVKSTFSFYDSSKFKRQTLSGGRHTFSKFAYSFISLEQIHLKVWLNFFFAVDGMLK